MIDKNSENWKNISPLMKLWFIFNFFQFRPVRKTATRVEVVSHIFGFLFCCLGFVSEAALAGGVLLLATAYLFHFLKWQGDRHGLWYEPAS